MPPKKLKNNQATHPAASVAACEDLMLCVLARLPVKSICRFKSVCKPWNHLFSTQEFIKMQFKLSSESKNQSFLVHRVNKNGSNTISVFNIDSNEKKARILDHPFNYTRIRIDIVGCCNGLVCIRRGKGFVLWNPAMNLFKTVSPLKDHGIFESASLGFGYDAKGDDFKVVRILLKNKGRLRMCVNWVEVYSVKSDSWTKIDPGFQFSELPIVSDATVNGNPYWVVKVDENDVLICFDMSKLVFKIVSLSTLDYNEADPDVEFADLNGSLGALVFIWRSDRIANVDAWVFDDGVQIWTKSHRVGPIEVKMNRVVRCLKDGRVLGKRPKGQLIMFNSETKCVKGLFNVAPEGQDFEIYEYTASMAFIEGMEKVTLRKRPHLRKRKRKWCH
ncbi:hypothetical protein CASFOL_027835 [Castilleja foliolosa]|uniref:F-box domain-containing protein n=1 Tax=Castilleja foliolosa TaxID=1961234 RepID=A0ABD3CHR1_9LAMI